MAGKRRRKGGWSRERGGRPSRLSDAVASALVQAMQLGMTRGDSAACIWNGKAKNAKRSIDRVRKVMHVYKEAIA